MPETQASATENPGPISREYLVFYSLSGVTLCKAANELEAMESVFATLHTLVGKSRFEGVSVADSDEVKLWNAEVEIDSVEPVETAPDHRVGSAIQIQQRPPR